MPSTEANPLVTVEQVPDDGLTEVFRAYLLQHATFPGSGAERMLVAAALTGMCGPIRF